MTTMNYEDFIKLGLNKNEAIVLSILASLGTADANTIIQKSKFHKNIVYDNLYKLRDKGIISTIQKDKKQFFTITDTDALIDYFENQQNELDIKKKLARELTFQIQNMNKERKLTQDAGLYRGVRAIRSFLYQSLEGGDSLVFGAPEESIEIMSPDFWINLNLKRVEKKQKTKMIFNQSIRTHGKRLPTKYTEIKYFEGYFEPLTETFIQDNSVSIIVWSKEPILFQIIDEFVAASYRKYFELLWKQAKK